MPFKAQIERLIRPMIAPDIMLGLSDPRVMHPFAFAEEFAMVANARDARKREFAAGRAAAHAALADLTVHPAPLLAGDDRAPCWPSGVVGSISHTRQIAACIAADKDRYRAVGLDLEEDRALAPDLIHEICTEAERSAIEGPRAAELALIIFCAKEATYKAQYPLTNMLFGFDHLEVELDLENHRFDAVFRRPAGMFSIGDRLPGRFGNAAGQLATVVTIGQGG